MKILRYILIVPATIFGWVAAFFMGLQLERLRTILLCPENLREGLDCYSEGWETFPIWLVAVGAALSAVFFVICSAIAAPENKLRVAIYSYFVGTILATAIIIITDYFFMPYIVAVLAGWFAVLLVARLTRTSITTVFQHLRRSKTVH